MESLFIACELIRTVFKAAIGCCSTVVARLIGNTLSFQAATAHLVDGVDSFHDPVLQKLEVAKLHRIVHAVVLQIFIPKALLSVAGW